MEAGTSGVLSKLGSAAVDLLGGLVSGIGERLAKVYAMIVWEVLGRPVRAQLTAKARGEDLGAVMLELSEGGVKAMWLLLNAAIGSKEQWVEVGPVGKEGRALKGWVLEDADWRLFHACKELKARGLVTHVRRIGPAHVRVRMADAVWEGGVLRMVEIVRGKLAYYGVQTDAHVGTIRMSGLGTRREEE